MVASLMLFFTESSDWRQAAKAAASSLASVSASAA
jgi:hypothetical protein